MLKLTIIMVIFILGLYFVMFNDKVIEGMKGHKQYRCPNILIQKGSRFYLYNSKLAKIPGVNPLDFSNLEDYVEFTKWQRSQGIKCPVLYLQESYDAQGNPVFKARQSPDNLQGGLPDYVMDLDTQWQNQTNSNLIDANRDDPPFNINDYTGFDEQNQYIGLDTPLDNMYNNNETEKANAMNADWAGTQYTQQLINQGAYSGDEVKIRVEN